MFCMWKMHHIVQQCYSIHMPLVDHHLTKFLFLSRKSSSDNTGARNKIVWETRFYLSGCYWGHNMQPSQLRGGKNKWRTNGAILPNQLYIQDAQVSLTTSRIPCFLVALSNEATICFIFIDKMSISKFGSLCLVAITRFEGKGTELWKIRKIYLPSPVFSRGQLCMLHFHMVHHLMNW